MCLTLQVPLKGNKQGGTLYLWASRPETSEPWSVDRLELGVEEHPGKRILLKATHTPHLDAEPREGEQGRCVRY